MKNLGLLSLLAALGASKNIDIAVGAKGLVYTPDTVTAAVGDVLYFSIVTGHSVAQASPNTPCAPISSSAIYSGFSAKTFAVTVNDTSPLYFYCTQITHCQTGMVMVVNPPSASTFSSYQDSSKATKSTMNPPKVQGGVLNKPAPSSTSPSPSPSPKKSGGGGGGMKSGGGGMKSGGGGTGPYGNGNSAGALQVGITSCIAAFAGVALVLVAM